MRVPKYIVVDDFDVVKEKWPDTNWNEAFFRIYTDRKLEVTRFHENSRFINTTDHQGRQVAVDKRAVKRFIYNDVVVEIDEGCFEI